jgi:hypothetical protein
MLLSQSPKAYSGVVTQGGECARRESACIDARIGDDGERGTNTMRESAQHIKHHKTVMNVREIVGFVGYYRHILIGHNILRLIECSSRLRILRECK